MRPPFHLTYCTNVHPGETWEETRLGLEGYLPGLKAALAPSEPFGIGLRLSAAAARALRAPATLAAFKAWLAAEGLYVFTINGFPHGEFHRVAVKQQVYAPDWTSAARLAYTLDLAAVLSELLPGEMRGSISTCPLAYGPTAPNGARQQAARLLAECAFELQRVTDATGKVLDVALEPEPDGLLETTADVARFFAEALLPVGIAALGAKGLSASAAERLLRDRVRVCLDTCHMAVMFEEPAAALADLAAAGIGVGKVQLSNALKVRLPESPSQRRDLGVHLAAFAEPVYLHQVVGRRADGTFERYRDLDAALAYLADSKAEEWRAHFHVPVFASEAGLLGTTQLELRAAVKALVATPVTVSLEVETYTWGVLPAAMQLSLSSSLERELKWATLLLQDPA